MDLYQNPAPEAALFQFILHGIHSQLDDVGGASLNGRIHGRPFGKGTAGEILAVDFRQCPDASEHGMSHAAFSGFSDQFFHISMDTAVPGKIGFNILFCLLAGDGNIAGQAKVTDSIDDPEIDGFRMGPLF